MNYYTYLYWYDIDNKTLFCGAHGRIVKAFDPHDQVVWGSITAVMCNSHGQAKKPHRLWPRSSNGYRVGRKIGSV